MPSQIARSLTPSTSPSDEDVCLKPQTKVITPSPTFGRRPSSNSIIIKIPRKTNPRRKPSVSSSRDAKLGPLPKTSGVSVAVAEQTIRGASSRVSNYQKPSEPAKEPTEHRRSKPTKPSEGTHLWYLNNHPLKRGPQFASMLAKDRKAHWVQTELSKSRNQLSSIVSNKKAHRCIVPHTVVRSVSLKARVSPQGEVRIKSRQPTKPTDALACIRRHCARHC